MLFIINYLLGTHLHYLTIIRNVPFHRNSTSSISTGIFM